MSQLVAAHRTAARLRIGLPPLLRMRGAHLPSCRHADAPLRLASARLAATRISASGCRCLAGTVPPAALLPGAAGLLSAFAETASYDDGDRSDGLSRFGQLEFALGELLDGAFDHSLVVPAATRLRLELMLRGAALQDADPQLAARWVAARQLFEDVQPQLDGPARAVVGDLLADAGERGTDWARRQAVTGVGGDVVAGLLDRLDELTGDLDGQTVDRTLLVSSRRSWQAPAELLWRTVRRYGRWTAIGMPDAAVAVSSCGRPVLPTSPDDPRVAAAVTLHDDGPPGDGAWQRAWQAAVRIG